MKNYRVLITTPDYPPQLGGLASFSRNLEQVFQNMDISVEVFHWKSVSELSDHSFSKTNFDLYLHVHFFGGLIGGFPTEKSVNFCHGSEILFYSPNLLKRFVKLLGKSKALRYLENSKANFFISEFTKRTLVSKGFKSDYGRDFILHNCIPTEGYSNSSKNWTSDESLKICSVARDVPHKNLNGVFELAKSISNLGNFSVDLYITSQRFKSEGQITVHSLDNVSDEEIVKVYKESHLNILLSLDHSHIGFVEGFGLTVLEAGLWGTPSIVKGTGGLPENVHHNYNGFVLSSFEEKEVNKLLNSIKENYSRWSRNSIDHVLTSHGLDVYKRVFSSLLGGKSG